MSDNIKIYTKEIRHCGDCPESFQKGYDGQVCKRTGKLIKWSMVGVPDNCPLPDKEGDATCLTCYYHEPHGCIQSGGLPCDPERRDYSRWKPKKAEG